MHLNVTLNDLKADKKLDRQKDDQLGLPFSWESRALQIPTKS